MPRFPRRSGRFRLTIGEGAESISWHFLRTATVEREFTVADSERPGVPRTRALLAVMLRALADWEGVLDDEGQPVPCSEEAFFSYIPPGLRRELLHRWVEVMGGELPPSAREYLPSPTAPREADHPAEAAAAPETLLSPTAFRELSESAVPQFPTAALPELPPLTDQGPRLPGTESLPNEAPRGPEPPERPNERPLAAPHQAPEEEPQERKQLTPAASVQLTGPSSPRRPPIPPAVASLSPTARSTSAADLPRPPERPGEPHLTSGAAVGPTADLPPSQGEPPADLPVPIAPSTPPALTGAGVPPPPAPAVSAGLADPSGAAQPGPLVLPPAKTPPGPSWTWSATGARTTPSRKTDRPFHSGRLALDPGLPEPDLSSHPPFVEAVERVVRRLEQRRAHEPWF